MFRILAEMIDPKLLCDVPFVLFAISNFLTSVGMNPPLLFVDAMAQELHGISEDDSPMILPAFGRRIFNDKLPTNFQYNRRHCQYARPHCVRFCRRSSVAVSLWQEYFCE